MSELLKLRSTSEAAAGDVLTYDKILTHLDVGVCVWVLEKPHTPASLRLLHCNPAAGVFLGVKSEEVLGKTIHEGFPGSEEMPLPGIFTRAIESGEPAVLPEIPYRDVFGEGTFSIHVHPLDATRCSVEFTNITERKRAEAQVAERTEELKRTVSELWSEMDLARKIQTVLVPKEDRLGPFEVAMEMRPAATVGGDYVDIFEADGASWFLVGDVSGHGVSAGLIMMMVQTAVRTVISTQSKEGRPPTPAAMLDAVNSAVHANLQLIGRDQYMTITALRVDPDGTVLHAGLHQDILVYRAATSAVDRIETEGMWLGVVSEAKQAIVPQRFKLSPGDSLLLFTDGITEARGPGDNEGQARLEALFGELSAKQASCAEIVKTVLDRAHEDDPHDDTTVLVARWVGG